MYQEIKKSMANKWQTIMNGIYPKQSQSSNPGLVTEHQKLYSFRKPVWLGLQEKKS